MDYLSKPRTEHGMAGSAINGGLGQAQCQTRPNVIQERKPSQMENAVSELSSQHARIDALVGELERRICAVLLPTPPSNPNGDECAAASPLADKLFSEARQARFLAERIDSIISRVDL